MSYFLADLLALCLAIVLGGLFYGAAGFGLQRVLTRVAAPDRVPFGEDPAPGGPLLLALALLPVLDALLLVGVGLPAVALLHGGLALWGWRPALAAMRAVPQAIWGGLAVWFLIILYAHADFDSAGRLHQSLTIVDTVKHAAVIDQLARHGMPLVDRFYLREGSAGYYHFFYIVPAAWDWLAGRMIDARMAFAGAAFWVGVGFPALLWRLAARAELIPDGRADAFRRWMMIALLVGGLDVLANAWYMNRGYLMPQSVDVWDDEISWGLTAAIWVPHHFSAVFAVFVAALGLQDAQRSSSAPRAAAAAIIVAALALASTFGLSVWIAVGAAAILPVWILTAADRKGALILLLLAGVIALLLAIPQMINVLHGRTDDPAFPLAFWLRAIGTHGFKDPATMWPAWAVLVTLIYIIEFGWFALGTAYYALSRRAQPAAPHPIRRLLVISALVALLLNAFVRSTLINNDFGWRVIWFTQIPMMVWTIHILALGRTRMARSPLARAFLVLGLLASCWTLVGLRFIRPPYVATRWDFINGDKALSFDMRRAYEWANIHLPDNAVIQHDPNAERRAFDFGLYSRHRIAVADKDANLFGASKASVMARMARLRPVFVSQDKDAIMRAATAEGVTHILFDRNNPGWRAQGGPPAGLACLHRTPTTCLVATTKALP